MAEHIDEVEDDDIQVVTLQLPELLHQLVGIGRGVDFVIGEGVVAAVALYLRLNQRRLVQVLALLVFLVHPQVGEHAGYLVGHES